jgi:hypothetical protein
MRGLVTGISRLARQALPHHAFKSLEEACTWLAFEARERRTPWPAVTKRVDAVAALRGARPITAASSSPSAAARSPSR